ncbi:MAG: hypothetical protein JEZ10_04710 [Verrucomicrobia bacterium]|nr:hypothetical protein [Verrucomicrobiota bacterium]
MLPQHGGVPNFNLRINGPILVALTLVLITGGLLTLSFYLNADPGDLAAQNRVKLSFIVTAMLSAMLLILGTGRWWHLHLWRRGNSQKHHRRRHRRNSSGHRHH